MGSYKCHIMAHVNLYEAACNKVKYCKIIYSIYYCCLWKELNVDDEEIE